MPVCNGVGTQFYRLFNIVVRLFKVDKITVYLLNLQIFLK